ncbi:DUF3147 family protein [Leptospira wolffii]|uniref:DUF3147 family protein n=1 Tax=Leptospira wolffii TaxID=409998 RepID=UPI0010828077|nr:DUF3147 family protein [Leptospira wolffii]TGK62328.1 DUF3147 family protein [Leptospira wolffii]TGK68155.1 DUF3147 family protein [Leptospira wolffii]TGK74288.1 DUF3147 family protein [Leptospira wolffii]TGL32137.1 DUF3147 family protein [Leptospira wolffii]
MFLIVKFFATAALVVLISEIAKRSDKLGAMVASLPLVTIFTLIWLHLENQEGEKVQNHAYYTFWYVLPTLPMFLAFPFLYRNFGFWSALGISCILTISLFGLLLFLGKKFGLDLG